MSTASNATGSNIFAPSNTNASANLNGLFKETYGDKLQELIPDGVKVLNAIKFMSKAKQPGNLFHQPVILGLEHGVTFASSDDDAFTLATPVAGQIKDATVRGSPMVLRSLLGYVAASRAVQGGAQAFMEATKFLVANMLRSMAKKLEIEMLYGQMGYAIASSVSGTGPYVITVDTKEWAPGIWAGAEGMPIEWVNTSAVQGTGVVTAVDMTARTVTLTLSTGSAPVASDVVYHKGAYGNEFPGIHKIITNTGSLFGINATQYQLFKGNSYSASSAALSFTKLNLAAARAVEKGLDSKLLVLVNPRTWANLLSDQAALRMYDSSYSSAKVEAGSKSITFYSQNGELSIEPSIYVKEGYAFMLCIEDWMRVGSQDISFKRPGMGDEFVSNVESAAAFEFRLFTDQAIFTSSPGKNVVITDIVNAQ